MPQVIASEDEKYLIVTSSELLISAFYEWFEDSVTQLPKYYAGYSTCFRKEVGSADTSLRKSNKPRSPGALNLAASNKCDIEVWFRFEPRWIQITSECGSASIGQARKLDDSHQCKAVVRWPPLWKIYDHASASEKHLLYNLDWPERDCGTHVKHGKCSSFSLVGLAVIPPPRTLHNHINHIFVETRTMKPVQFACLVIVATASTAMFIGPPCSPLVENDCLPECKPTSAEANCLSNFHYPSTQQTNDCYTCCACLYPPEY
ncbi:hypothetical protein K503DRAFT_787828 [Rhizopogon vinicolor AM-OR11-026]|uniref:Uncharacterized protein n=1 Tax=Rhizopogon vinicolor AM-OR11-026 TaxID=1314800 RepID=A0A1B7MFQ3_9AGAM|nr:hypothetical protein K503DRAFT_787828 [Rhizopogon vinicolor AM-OR11-026]